MWMGAQKTSFVAQQQSIMWRGEKCPFETVLSVRVKIENKIHEKKHSYIYRQNTRTVDCRVSPVL